MTINKIDTGLTRTVDGLPAWLKPLMINVSFLGLPIVVVIVATFAGLVALLTSHPGITAAFALSIAGLGLSTTLKNYVHRMRPGTLYVTSMHIKSYSFPSGHSYGALVLYGLLGHLSLKFMPSPWGIITAVALSGLITLIGISRIYLGAHFPTDVIGGWVLGAVSLALIILLISPA